MIHAETKQRLHNGRIVHTWKASTIFERIGLAWMIFCGAIRMLRHGEISAWGEDPYDSVYHENARLRRALTLSSIPAQAALDDKAPPLRINVSKAREIMEVVDAAQNG